MNPEEGLPLLEHLLARCVELGASDLHLTHECPPYVRIDGVLQPLPEAPVLSTGQTESIAQALMNPRQQEVFAQRHTLDLAHSLGEVRFRINVFRQQGQVALAIRRLENVFRTFEELLLPKSLEELSRLRDGLVLITGPTGSGKTTTLATLIHQINQHRACHIITVEDPLEYLHRNIKSLVHQRELYTDVPSFAEAVRSALREDPDVILVGEMRDLETMRAAITAAETGHLVFSTLHTGDAVGALDRIIGVFPADEQQSVRQQLSMVLRAVVAQRLLPRRDRPGRVPVVELLRVTTGVAHLIRTGKPQQIYAAIETGTSQGMQTLEAALAQVIHQGLVEPPAALALARDPQLVHSRLRLLAQKAGQAGGG